MNSRSFSLTVSSDIGNVTATLFAPDDPFCMLTLAHGAGAGMDHAFMVSLATMLAEKGIANLRFNFPSAEQKKIRPDVPAVAHKTVAAAIACAHEMYPSLPLFASGKSFGGRMSSQYLAVHHETPVKGIVFFGFPLHPPKKPGIERAEHLKHLEIPMLFLQGTRDELATMDLLEAVCSTLPQSTLVKIDKANHMFKAGKEDNISVLAAATHDWLVKQTETAK